MISNSVFAALIQANTLSIPDALTDPEIVNLLQFIGGILTIYVFVSKRLKPVRQFIWDRFLEPVFELVQRLIIPPREEFSSNENLVKLESLVGYNPWRQDMSLHLLSATNKYLANLAAHRLGESTKTSSSDAERVWEDAIRDEDWEDLRRFIDTPRKGSDDETVLKTLHRLVDESFRERSQEPTQLQVCISADGGAGKSTHLLRFYLDLVTGDRNSSKVPVPMLLLPRAVRKRQVDLKEASSRDFLNAALGVWLTNRNIDATDRQLRHLTEDLKRKLEAGQILLLLDGWDELENRGLASKGQFKDVLARSTHWIRCERPHRHREVNCKPVELHSDWSNRQFHDYLNKRWPGHPEWRELLIRHMQDAPAWLRIPRFFSFLTDHLDLRYDGGEGQPPTEAYLLSVSQGQYELVQEAVNLAVKKRAGLSEPNEIEQAFVSLGELAKERLSEYRYQCAAFTDDRVALLNRLNDIVTQVVGGSGYLIPTVFAQFFLGYRIAKHLDNWENFDRHDRLDDLSTNIWSHLTVTTCAHWLVEWLKDEATGRVISALESEFLKANEGNWSRDHRVATHNLIALLEEASHRAQALAGDNATKGPRPPIVRSAGRSRARNFGRLCLREAEFEGFCFERCSFQDSDLTGANLRSAGFEECDFRGSSLRRVDALRTAFVRCKFDDPADGCDEPPEDRNEFGQDGEENCFAQGMLLKNNLYPPEEEDENEDLYKQTKKLLISAGAIDTRSRYRGEWGQFFADHPEWLLGPNYSDLEEAYQWAIREAVLSRAGHEPVVLVDMMAGGSRRALDILLYDEKLASVAIKYLAVDRDVDQLKNIEQKLAENGRSDSFRAWEHRIRGEDGVDGQLLAGIETEIAKFSGGRRAADVIIAKKALHEIPRTYQPHVLVRCHDLLEPGGRLVVFADSPGSCDLQKAVAEGTEVKRELDRVRDAMKVTPTLRPGEPLCRQMNAEVDVLQRVREAAIKQITLDDSSLSEALFCNLWVLLKDWTNDNVHEVEHRFFSSSGEILSWASEKAQFISAAEVVVGENFYRLMPPTHNEHGIRYVLNHIKTDAGWQQDVPILTQKLKGIRNERLSLLGEYTRHHLWNKEKNIRTRLGERLEAQVTDATFEEIDAEFSEVHVPGAVEFDFPVHILRFRKTTR